MAGVFISYRTPDVALASRVAREIKAAGHEVWLDAWHIKIGDSIIARINDGLALSTYVVLCYSKHSLDTPWITREWHSALARQLDGFGVKILPVRLKGGNPPPILADLRYADLERDWDLGMAQLLSAIG